MNKEKIASLRIRDINELCPYDRIRLDKWLKKTRKEIKENYKKYDDKCEFALMK
jgi:hypothetical protein